MAKAVYNPGRTETKTVVVEEPSVTMTITTKEAAALKELLGGYISWKSPLSEKSDSLFNCLAHLVEANGFTHPGHWKGGVILYS